MTELSLRGPGVNYYEIPAIHQKRTLAFVNNFVTSTVSMMNKLARSCEMKLQKFDTQIQRMDACLRIIEAKLDSIPGLDSVAPPPVPTTVAVESPIVPTQKAEPPTTEVEPQPEQTATQTARQDPRYAHYFRMLHVGVPLQAVKLKIRQDGLDPDVLDNPDSAVPPPTARDSNSGSQSSSSDSD